MRKLYYSGILLISIVLLVQASYASHQVEFRAPTSITTTVGELTTIQVDIKNAGATTEFYKITITATSPNKIEITNPNIDTKNLKPGESTSIFSNIRALTENPDPITIQIFRDSDLSHFVPIVISVQSKKFSLPEFGLLGFLQIVGLSTVLYSILRPERRK